MLILNRTIGSRLFIGDDVILTFLGLDGRQMRVGIDAPRDVVILREEVKIREELQRELDKERSLIRDAYFSRLILGDEKK